MKQKLLKKVSSKDSTGLKLMSDSLKEDVDFSMHRCLVPARDEDIPRFSKEPRTK